MIILISCAKTMSEKELYNIPYSTSPIFQEQAIKNAFEMAQYTTEELEEMLHVNTDIALINHLRYRDFISEESPSIPAICAYNGTVYKNINITDFSQDDFEYTQNHLLITSFLYGLLRPFDKIKCYRLEGNIHLSGNGDKSMFEFWKEELTELLINLVNKNGGTIVYLASEEMKNLFHWKLIENKLNIIYPEFYIMKKDKLKQIVIYTKMCRGQMTRFILKNRIDNVEMIKSFSWEGFAFSEELSTDRKISFVFY